MKISVCMATCNGERYIKQQIDSIVLQLASDDELIISDDNSSDKTIEIIQGYNDPRLKLYEHQGLKSPIFNFQNAINKVQGDIIVLADQDDIWKENKLNIIRKSFIEDLDTVALKLYNGRCINEENEIIKTNLFEYIDVKEGIFNNILKNSFIGCNIAFTKDLCKVSLPFPKDIPMHDQWLGICAYMFGNVEFVDEMTMQYRLHNHNYTKRKKSYVTKIVWRVDLVKNLMIRYLNVNWLKQI